jgi:5-methyltetrahydropteroyltriglutamate--homocysteine methyltransferase
MPGRYRADHVGSLLRPAELLQARADHAAGRLGSDELREVEDRAIQDALELQRQVGLDVFTDGEFRRGSWLTNMAEAVEGFVADRILIEWYGPGGGTEASTAQVVGGRLQQTRRLTGHEVAFLKTRSPGPLKVTVPSPSSFLLVGYRPGLTDRVYPTRAEMAQELARIVRREMAALADEGVPYIQLDAPYYTSYLDARVRERLRQNGVDPDQAFEDSLAADRAALTGVQRQGVTLGMHLCRGNSRSRWFTEGGYDPIAEKLFGTLSVDRFLLEYDTERAGGFAPLRFVPRGRTVVLGLVTTKEPQLESPDALLRRIDEASRYVPVEDLAISPQCGFASVAAGNRLSLEDQRRKLELVVATARKVWGGGDRRD